jgi:hypothetical protein
MKTLYNYSSSDCENIEGYEMEPEGFYKEKQQVSNIDINKVEAAEYENFLVNSGYYNRMRCLDE